MDVPLRSAPASLARSSRRSGDGQPAGSGFTLRGVSATRSGRQLSRASAPLLKKIRELAAEEVIRALVAGAEVSTVRQIAELVAECDARLERRL